MQSNQLIDDTQPHVLDIPVQDTAMKLILGSSFLAVVPIIKRLMPDRQGKRIAFISTASYVESYGILSRVMQYRLKQLGFAVRMLDVATASPEYMEDTLARADMFYVCGGNTFYLLDQLRRTGADVLLTKRVREGVLYVGESAGSVICGPDIAYISAMDDIKTTSPLRSTQGLGFIPCAIVPHVGSWLLGDKSASILQAGSAGSTGSTGSGSTTLIPLHNDQALVVTDGQMYIETHHSVLARLLDR